MFKYCAMLGLKHEEKNYPVDKISKFKAGWLFYIAYMHYIFNIFFMKLNMQLGGWWKEEKNLGSGNQGHAYCSGLAAQTYSHWSSRLVTCRVSHVTCHLSLTPTATDTDLPPDNSPIMHCRLVCKDPKSEEKKLI